MAYMGQTVPLPIGQQGFTGSRNPTRMQPGHLTAVEGLSLEGGILQKEGGVAKVNPIAIGGGSAVIAGINWCPVPAAHRDVVFLASGDVLKDDGSGVFGTTLAAGLTPVRVPPPVFATGGGETVGAARKLFMFSSSNQVKVLSGDGVTMSNIAQPAADWAASFPTFGLHHAGRLWAGGNSSDPHRMYASTLADHEDFVDAGFQTFAVYPGEGDMIVGAVSYRGVLVIFKYPQGVYIIDTRDPDPTNWSVNKLSGAVGAVNHNSIVPIENDILYMDEGGNLHLLSATNDFGDVNTSNISQVSDLREFIKVEADLSQIRRAVGDWYAAKRQAWFTLPTLASSDNDLRLIVDFNEQVPRFLPSRRDTMVSLWMRPATLGSRPAAGDASGFVWTFDEADRNKEGDPYPLRFETANTDLAFVDGLLATKHKNGQFLEIMSEPRGNWDLTIEVYWDDILTDVKQFNMGVGGAGLDSFVLDTDALTSAVVSNIRKKIVGSGRRFRMVGYNDGVDENVAIAGFLLSFTVGDERDSQS